MIATDCVHMRKMFVIYFTSVFYLFYRIFYMDKTEGEVEFRHLTRNISAPEGHRGAVSHRLIVNILFIRSPLEDFISLI